MVSRFIDEVNISQYVDFAICKGHSKKKDKDYYVICLKIDDEYFPIKFLTEKQFNSLRKEI